MTARTMRSSLRFPRSRKTKLAADVLFFETMKTCVVLVLIALCVLGCATRGQRQLSSVVVPTIALQEDSVSDVVKQMNDIVKSSYSVGVPPTISLDFTVPDVRDRTRSSLLADQVEAFISDFRDEQRLAHSDLFPITLKLTSITVWRLISYLPEIEPRIAVVANNAGAVIRLAIPDTLECRAYSFPVPMDSEFEPEPEEQPRAKGIGEFFGLMMPKSTAVRFLPNSQTILCIADPSGQKRLRRLLKIFLPEQNTTREKGSI